MRSHSPFRRGFLRAVVGCLALGGLGLAGAVPADNPAPDKKLPTTDEKCDTPPKPKEKCEDLKTDADKFVCENCGPKRGFDVRPKAPFGKQSEQTQKFVKEFSRFLPPTADPTGVLPLAAVPDVPVDNNGDLVPLLGPGQKLTTLTSEQWRERAIQRYLFTPHPKFAPRPCFSRIQPFTGVPTGTKMFRQDRSDKDYPFTFDALVSAQIPSEMSAIYVKTPPGIYPPADPRTHPPGTNMLPTVYGNAYDAEGTEMPNTVASLPNAPYNLHDGDPIISRLENEKSPTDDLRQVLDDVYKILTDRPYRQLWERGVVPRSPADHMLNPPIRTEVPETIKDYQKRVQEGHAGRVQRNQSLVSQRLQWALDIIEGNDGIDSKVPSSRAYRGFPLLNHSGHKRMARVVPVYDEQKKIVGATAHVKQIWYDGRIQSNAMFVDLGTGGLDANLHPGETLPQARADLPFTTTYDVNVLRGGNDDFSTFIMYSSHPHPDKPKYKIPLVPNLSMDQTFFPMTDGTKNVFKIKNSNLHYYELNYTWGWRKHPPRAQAMESANGMVPPIQANSVLHTVRPNHERWVFEGYDSKYDLTKGQYKCHLKDVGIDPNAADGIPSQPANIATWNDRAAKLKAMFPKLSEVELELDTDEAFKKQNALDVVHKADLDPYRRIGDIAPAKRMWRAFRAAKAAIDDLTPEDAHKHDLILHCLRHLMDARDAYQDWKDRTRLPAGIRPDPDADLTLLYVNNTVYGEYARGGWTGFETWRSREDGNHLKVTLYNGDHFPHAFHSVDFGGNRGWENQFKSTLPVGGVGSFFTFGRVHTLPLTPPGVFLVPPAIPLQSVCKKDGKFDPCLPKEAGSSLRPFVRRRTANDPDSPPIDGGGNVIGVDENGFPTNPEERTYLLAGFNPSKPPDGVQLGVMRAMLQFNYDPSRRLRVYNFDPLHHDVAIFPVH